MKWSKFGSILQDFIYERLSNIWTTLYDENILHGKKIGILLRKRDFCYPCFNVCGCIY